MIKMNLSRFLEILMIISSVCAATSKQPTTTPSAIDALANHLPTCPRSDPKFNECVKNATVTLKDLIVEGIPELQLPSLDPLRLPSVKLQQNTPSLSYKAILVDVVLYGLADYEFTEVESDMENLTITLKAKFDHIYVDTEYILMGEYEMLPVEGSGRLMVNMTDNYAVFKLFGALLQRKGETYFVNHDVETKLSVGDAEAVFENLYTGGDMKSQITEHILKKHSDEVMGELKPAVETIASMIIDDIATKFFKSFPFERLFPE